MKIIVLTTQVEDSAAEPIVGELRSLLLHHGLKGDVAARLPQAPKPTVAALAAKAKPSAT